jgi:pimeloyl-ACP methyl ester carboxylesterase/glycine cleavage system regulatory protein
MVSTISRGDLLEWRTLTVDGRDARVAVGGHGLPVLFLHGWSLGPHAYEEVLLELMDRGCRVYAPALPGFGGTANLPGRRRTLEGYAAWVEAFLEAENLDRALLVVGHSFGGGVAIRLAHDQPDRISQLVLINSVGTPSGSSGPTLVAEPYDRPLWEFGLNVTRELFWTRDGHRIVQAIGPDLVRNAVTNPGVLIEIGLLARKVDLTAELTVLRDRDVPMVVLWSEGDGVLPLSSFDTLCALIGTEGRVLPGGHSWLLANPRALSEVLDNLVRVQVAERETSGMNASTVELRSLLRGTKIPARTVTRLLRAASPLWMMSERPSVLAGDLVLCHPPLAADEVRAVARPLEDLAVYRVTVVAADRPGLLADTAAALSDQRLTVLSASVATWADSSIALHSLTVRSAAVTDPDWASVGERLRTIATDPPPATRYRPTGRAAVTAVADSTGRLLVTVTAPDGLGLLGTITAWFAEHDVSIEAAEITTRNGLATDRFHVVGELEPGELADHLSFADRRRWPLPRLHLPRLPVPMPRLGGCRR